MLGGALWGSYGTPKPQKAHLDAALRRLEARPLEVRYTKAQAQNLAKVTDEQWRELLHVPKAMVADRADRQRVRTILVHNLALHGLDRVKQGKASVMQAVTNRLIDDDRYDLASNLHDEDT